MEFICKKCEKKVEFLHLKNKDSRLFELCDDCYESEVLKANSEYQVIKNKNKYEKSFYIFVISFVILSGSYFCFTDGFSGNCDPEIDEFCANYKNINESD